MKKIIITIIVIGLAVWGYFWFVKNPSEVNVNSNTGSEVSNGKLNMDVVCQSALAYMTFPDGASADQFIIDCKEGKYPEVVERYKADMNLGDGATI